MSRIENKPVNSPAPENWDLKPNNIPQPQTFTQRLRGETVCMLRDFRGTSLRLTTYTVLTTVEFTFLYTQNVNQEDVVNIICGTLIPMMVIGEFYLWNKISQRLPWFRTRYEDPRDRN